MVTRCSCRLWLAETRRVYKRRLLLLRGHPSRHSSRLQIPSWSKGILQFLVTNHIHMLILQYDAEQIYLLRSLQGIWTGMLGGTCMQTLILFWITFRTDWNKEVCMYSTYIGANKRIGDHTNYLCCDSRS